MYYFYPLLNNTFKTQYTCSHVPFAWIRLIHLPLKSCDYNMDWTLLYETLVPINLGHMILQRRFFLSLITSNRIDPIEGVVSMCSNQDFVWNCKYNLAKFMYFVINLSIFSSTIGISTPQIFLWEEFKMKKVSQKS